MRAVPAWSQICASVIQGCSGPCLGALLCRDEATSDNACSTLEAATDVAWTEPVGGFKTMLGVKGGPQTAYLTNDPLPNTDMSTNIHTPSPGCELLFLKKPGPTKMAQDFSFTLCPAVPLVNTQGTCYAKHSPGAQPGMM